MPPPPQPLSLRLLADDLTGALDSAAAFAGEVPVHLDPPAAAAVRCGRVEALTTATRDIPQAELPAALADAIAWLQGADIAFKKVDSLLRGNTFAEVVHIARAGGFDEVVFAPAFPAQGRFLLDGRLCLRPPGRAEGGATADDGPDCRAAFAALGLPGQGITLTLPELRSDADLREIARGAQLPTPRRRLWCGSAGLAHAMAQSMAQSMAQAVALESVSAATDAHSPREHTPGGAPVDAPAESDLPLGAGPTLLLTASHHPVLRQQWQRLRQARPQALAGGRSPEPAPAELLAALADRRQPLPDDPLIALDLSPAGVLAPEAAAALLARQLALVVDLLPRPGRLAVVGGDTLLALCRASGATGLRALASTRSGWGRAHWIGGCWDGVPCQSRSGAFGGPDDLVEALSEQ
jgi:uncharacterized protein YgbK (DUF1537 family)